MRHNREDVIERTIEEFAVLNRLVASLSYADWERPLARPAGRDPWTVKDALAHITHWQANQVRSIRKERRPPEERGLEANGVNRVVYLRWRDRSPAEVVAWNRQVQADVLDALGNAPDEYFSGKEHNEQWPFDLVGHSAEHRRKDIERAVGSMLG